MVASRPPPVPTHNFGGHRGFHHGIAPGFLWAGPWYPTLWSWDDAYFSDLKYSHYDRYGYWPYRWDGRYPSGDVEVVNGEARYHYDRGYPYSRYDYDRGAAYSGSGPDYDEPAPMRCRTQWAWSDEDRKDVPVRICSN
jgi:hypothetical protein